MQAVKRHCLNTEFENPGGGRGGPEGGKAGRWRYKNKSQARPFHITQISLQIITTQQTVEAQTSDLTVCNIFYLPRPLRCSLGNSSNCTSWVCTNLPTHQSSIQATFSLQDVAASKAREALQEFPLVSSFKGLQSGRLKTSTEENLACGLLSQKGAGIQGGRRSLQHDLGFI